MKAKKSAMLGLSLSTLLALCACSSLARATPMSVGGYDLAIKKMRGFVQKKVRENKVVGLSVALVDDQKIIWSEGFGWADKKQKSPATADTVYQVGSTTKLFTATAIMRLAEQGLVDINAPLTEALPDFAIRRHNDSQVAVTPRNMMMHYSGLPSDYANEQFSPDAKPSAGALLERLKDDYLAREPNISFSYSNVAFSLLGYAIEAVTKQPYAEYIKADLLVPLGMSNAQISGTAEAHPFGAKSYFGGKQVAPLSVNGAQAAGALISSVNDMARFAQMVFADGRSGKQQILRPGTLAEMMRYQDTKAPFALQPAIGLGWMLSSDYGDEVGLRAGHGGSTYLHNSAFELLPKHKLGVIVLANSASAQAAVYEIADELLAIALQTKKGLQTPALGEAVIPAKNLPAKNLDLQRLPGVYTPVYTAVDDEEGSGLMTITVDGDHFNLAQDGDTLNLYRRENGLYYFSYRLLGFPIDLEGLEQIGVSHREINGRELLIANVDKSEYIIGQKIQTYVIPDAWQSRLGEYEAVNLKGGIVLENVELVIENNLLLVRAETKWPFMKKGEVSETVLVPLNADQAVIHGMGRGTGETIRVVVINEIEHLSHNGFLLRKKP